MQKKGGNDVSIQRRNVNGGLQETRNSSTPGQSGMPVCTGYKPPTRKEARERGDKPQVDFLDCVAWGSQAENLANYQKKGSLILIKGRIQKRQYQNQEGENRYAVEVIANQVLFMPKNGNVPPPVEEDEAPF